MLPTSERPPTLWPEGLFAREGEIVTCTNGHKVCEVARDIHSSEIPMHTSFRCWQEGYEPKSGLAPDCQICGAPAFNRPDGRPGLHIGGVWRP